MDLLRGIAILILMPAAACLFRLAWELYRMPYSRQLELREQYERKKIIRDWLRGMS